MESERGKYQKKVSPVSLRPFSFALDYTPQALSSVLVCFGNTRVITAVSVAEELPHWLKSKKGKSGWLTAEYTLLPSSTHPRHKRERGGRIAGRTQEIQRLISRTLRAMIDLQQIPDLTFTVDCDVISADGGTRTSSINGAVVALMLAVQRLLKSGKIKQNPIVECIAATSVALVDGQCWVDPDYAIDLKADADVTVALSASGRVVEIQGAAEKKTYTKEDVTAILDHADSALAPLFDYYRSLESEMFSQN